MSDRYGSFITGNSGQTPFIRGLASRKDWSLFGIIVVCLFLSLTGSALSQIATESDWQERPHAEEIDTSLRDFLQVHPEVQSERDAFGRLYLYGAPFAWGETDESLINDFLSKYSTLFGLNRFDLELIFASDLPTRDATVLAYRQVVDGTPVENSAVRFLTRPDTHTGERSLVYAAGHLALEPVGGYSAVLISPEEALQKARSQWTGSPDLNWKPAQLLIEPSASRRAESRKVYRVVATGLRPEQEQDWAISIDPETGETLAVKNQILHVDVEGTVTAQVTQGLQPDTGTNPPQSTPLEGLNVGITGGANAVSQSGGAFVIPHGGVDPVEVLANLTGSWCSVVNNDGANIFSSLTATPPGPADLVMNPVYDPKTVAEVNAYHFTHVTHNFIRSRTTGNPGIDVSLTANVNLLDTCNAFFSPGEQSINFFQEGGGCVNTSFASVVAHEYGHFIVNRLGLAQGGFGEGFSDVVSMLILDDPIIGRGFLGPGTEVRDPIAANIQYPCPSTSVHTCGQILGSCFWLLRESFGSLLGSQPGLEFTQQLFVDWSLVTIGGIGDSSAHPETAIEVLVLDDDDGTLANGTPNFDLICSVFGTHSIDCPVSPPLTLVLPDGLPANLNPNIAETIRVTAISGTTVVDNSSGQLRYRQGGAGAFTVTPINWLGGTDFIVELPGQGCGGEVEVYFRFLDQSGAEFLLPETGSAAPFSLEVISQVDVSFSDDMESDNGWTVGEATDTATTGVWVRVDPIGTAAQPESGNGTGGAFAWVTGQGPPGGALGENDIDGGETTLKSPVFDLSQFAGSTDPVEISYWRWYSNGTGASPYTDTATIQITNDLTNWVGVEVLGPQSGPDTNGGWVFHSFPVESLIPLTSTMQVRFMASDTGQGSIVEMAVDDFEIAQKVCFEGPVFTRGDANGDGSVDVSDAVTVLQYLFEGFVIECVDSADYGDNGSVNIADPVGIVGFLFGGESPPSAPYPSCGIDPTETDGLPTCQSQSNCP
ncbi:hypothetical protein CBD41_03535 [bacterium TMED181]|nr:hypothetical protein [Planctomycetota bacterium]OUW45733.1 MAG: hypothetical protein CBD41_03535 [bacterium TMED181]